MPLSTLKIPLKLTTFFKTNNKVKNPMVFIVEKSRYAPKNRRYAPKNPFLGAYLDFSTMKTIGFFTLLLVLKKVVNFKGIFRVLRGILVKSR